MLEISIPVGLGIFFSTNEVTPLAASSFAGLQKLFATTVMVTKNTNANEIIKIIFLFIS